ncbi:MAG: hypothetical protein DRQ78_12450 [Epsilonproteobacteria bacterium]|nr:MAG: hypothetical protein DRQ78_12450 [Campylobacterota bacterium]
MFGKKKKSYGSVMASFSEVVVDLQEISDREEVNIGVLAEEHEKIERKITTSKAEMANCQTAIDNVRDMFPNI